MVSLLEIGDVNAVSDCVESIGETSNTWILLLVSQVKVDSIACGCVEQVVRALNNPHLQVLILYFIDMRCEFEDIS